MSLKIGLQMDPLENIDISADSTVALALEAQKRGHTLFHYLATSLTLRMTEVLARIRPIQLKVDDKKFFDIGEEKFLPLASMDVILMRQDPPFNMSYITSTHILEHLEPETLIVNRPSAVRNAPEKLLVAHFPDLIPPTLITSDAFAAKEFRRKHRDLIIKPLFGNGGSGVFHIGPEDENFSVVLETQYASLREPVILQRYLPDVRHGDKRIILINGEPAGAINRAPMEGEARANMHVGAKAEPANLTERDRAICRAIGPKLRDEGLIFTGIDVIGDYLTEINVTSPTGIQEYLRFTGVNLACEIWDVIEAQINTG